MNQNSPEEKSKKEVPENLFLNPVEQLEKKIQRTGRPAILIRSKRFEILSPYQQKTMEEMIYSLLDAGIQKAKLYAIDVTKEAYNQLAEKQPLLRDMIWSKIQSFISLFQKPSQVNELSKFIVEEEDDYVVISKVEEKKEEPDPLEESDNLSKSSYVCFDGLKSLNILKRLDGGPDEPLAVSVFPVTPNDKEYKYSFNLTSNSSESSSSIVYAPEISSMDLRIINCHATEFYLVENTIIIQDSEEIIQAQFC